MKRESVARETRSAGEVDAGLRATVLDRARRRGEAARWLLAAAAGLTLLLAACANRGMQVPIEGASPEGSGGAGGLTVDEGSGGNGTGAAGAGGIAIETGGAYGTGGRGNVAGNDGPGQGGVPASEGGTSGIAGTVGGTAGSGGELPGTGGGGATGPGGDGGAAAGGGGVGGAGGQGDGGGSAGASGQSGRSGRGGEGGRGGRGGSDGAAGAAAGASGHGGVGGASPITCPARFGFEDRALNGATLNNYCCMPNRNAFTAISESTTDAYCGRGALEITAKLTATNNEGEVVVPLNPTENDVGKTLSFALRADPAPPADVTFAVFLQGPNYVYIKVAEIPAPTGAWTSYAAVVPATPAGANAAGALSLQARSHGSGYAGAFYVDAINLR